MKFLKGIGGVALAIGGALASLGVLVWILEIGAGLLQGASRIAIWLLPYMAWAYQICIVVSVVLLLPMAFFHKTREWAATGFLFTSFVYGFIVWVLGLLITMQYWGPIAVIIGLFFIGIGVVPIGMVAAAFKHQWFEVGILVVGLVLTFGARIFGAWLAEKYQSRNLAMGA